MQLCMQAPLMQGACMEVPQNACECKALAACWGGGRVLNARHTWMMRTTMPKDGGLKPGPVHQRPGKLSLLQGWQILGSETSVHCPISLTMKTMGTCHWYMVLVEKRATTGSGR